MAVYRLILVDQKGKQIRPPVDDSEPFGAFSRGDFIDLRVLKLGIQQIAGVMHGLGAFEGEVFNTVTLSLSPPQRQLDGHVVWPVGGGGGVVWPD